MQAIINHPKQTQSRLRAMVEIVGGELKIYPIADTDRDEQRILDALRFVQEDFRAR